MRKLIAALAVRNKGSRLYGKPLQNLDSKEGVTVLDQIVDLVKTVPCIEGIVLGISEGVENETFVEYAENNGLDHIRGDEKDVLKRLVLCGEKAASTDVFRVTTESPFKHFELIEGAWELHVRNDHDATFLDQVIDGTGFELFKLVALQQSHRDGEARHRSEFCALYIREHPELFTIHRLAVEAEWQRRDLRLTVDYPEDLIVCREVYRHFKDRAPRISVPEITRFLDAHPELVALVAPYCEEGYNTMNL